MSAWRVDEPTETQLRNVAELRYAWVVGHGHKALDDEPTFISRFVAWMQQHAETHRCRVVLDTDGTVLGFGFLALTHRVPGPHAGERTSADIQAVYVRPEHRGAGVGRLLIESLVALARTIGAEHVTVHSSPGAVSAYRRAGFTADPLMMFQDTRE